MTGKQKLTDTLQSRPSSRHARWALTLLLAAPGVALPAALLMLSSSAAAADLTGQLRGAVVDGDGLPVPGVVINATSDSLQGGRSVDTDLDGNFRILGLPPGDYRVEAQKAGFQTVRIDVKVFTGRAAMVDIVLPMAQASEEIVIVEQKPTVDVTSTRTGVVLTKEMLRDIPNAGRDYQSAAQLSPGVVGGGNPNMRGGVFTSNQYYIDGVNTTDPLTGTFSSNINFDAMEEVQVITGGMDAEYGRALGGALNIVTRSGGNEFEGDVQLLYSGKNTAAYTPLPDEGDLDDIEYFDVSTAVNVGGPIVKDKLWFFASFQLNRSDVETTVPDEVGRIEPMAPRYWNSQYYYGKLTWSPTSSHRMWLTFSADPTNIENSTQDPYTLPSGEEWWRQGGWLASVGHLWTPGGSSILETEVFTQRSYIVTVPIQELWCKRGQWDYSCDPADNYGYSEPGWFSNTGFAYGPEPFGSNSYRNRHSANVSFTQLFDFLGEHQAKTGVGIELMQSYADNLGVGPETEEEQNAAPDTSGYALYEPGEGCDPNDPTCYEPDTLYLYNSQYDSTAAGILISWYLQDVWQPTPRLTIRPGVRMDYSSLHMRPFFDSEFSDKMVFSTINLAPRIGTAYDLTGDGRTSVRAYYGRFYDPGYLAVADTLSDTDTGYATFNWDPNREEWTPAGQSGAGYFLAADDLKTPHSDEFNVGISRDVGDGWGLDLGVTYEETNNRWEDDEVNQIWNADGTQVIGGRNGSTSAVYRMRTPDEVFNQYTSIEVQANRQFDENWGMVANYTWSRTYGFLQSNTTALASGTFDNYTQNDDDVGLQPYDTPHAFKIAGSYRDNDALPLSESTSIGFLTGWNMEATSGTPYRKLYYNDYYGGWYNAKDKIDGTYRLPMYSRVDLKAGLTIAVARTTWDLTVECFNVFNDRTVTDVDTRYGAQDGQGMYVDDDGDAYWGRPEQRQKPRYFQLGLRGEFN